MLGMPSADSVIDLLSDEESMLIPYDYINIHIYNSISEMCANVFLTDQLYALHYCMKCNEVERQV